MKTRIVADGTPSALLGPGVLTPDGDLDPSARVGGHQGGVHPRPHHALAGVRGERAVLGERPGGTVRADRGGAVGVDVLQRDQPRRFQAHVHFRNLVGDVGSRFFTAGRCD